jgi:predicted glycoside hydrolase/deacetylase ChbG (UPF0249 family)
MLQCELPDGFAELSCHPGWIDSSLSIAYHAEREIELKTLSDPRLRAFLREQRITFRDVSMAGTEP